MSLILGIDTATADTAVAVCSEAEPLAEERIGPEPGGRPRHARALLSLVERVLEPAGGWEAVDRIAVGIGPGSFTGIRIGVATARALAQARGLPLAGVESTAALAAGIEPGAGRERMAVIDARRGEVYAALAAAGESVAGEPIVARPAELGGALGGSGGSLAAGDGAVRFRDELEAAGFEVLPDEDPAHRLSARHVCALGRMAAGGPPRDTRPLYLRRPDAERWRERDRRG
jgi:tRNA threonylcarbamoyladenosine biosynthesis protein TsaB